MYYSKKWSTHLVPTKIETFHKLPFLESVVKLKQNLFLPNSEFSLDYVKNRAFSVYGMSKRAFMYNYLTIGK